MSTPSAITAPISVTPALPKRLFRARQPRRCLPGFAALAALALACHAGAVLAQGYTLRTGTRTLDGDGTGPLKLNNRGVAIGLLLNAE